jgi:hypothetical protein
VLSLLLFPISRQPFRGPRDGPGRNDPCILRGWVFIRRFRLTRPRLCLASFTTPRRSSFRLLHGQRGVSTTRSSARARVVLPPAYFLFYLFAAIIVRGCSHASAAWRPVRRLRRLREGLPQGVIASSDKRAVITRLRILPGVRSLPPIEHGAVS